MSRSVFYDLSVTLPEKERRDLLQKIKKSLNREDDEEIASVHQEDNPKVFTTMIEKEIEALGVFSRFILWLKHIFSGKKKEELYLDQKTQNIKHEINRKWPGLTGFETRNLTPEFADVIYDLYLAAVPLIKVFKKFFNERMFMEEGVLYLLEKRLETPVTGLEQIMTGTEMEEIFEKTGNKEAVKKVVEQRLSAYVKGLAPEVFKQVEDILLPLHQLKEIILYPYASFFQLFNYIPEQNPETRPIFKNASALFTISYLEKLLSALNSVIISGNPPDINTDIVALLSRLEIDTEMKDEDMLRQADQNADDFRSDIRYLCEKSHAVYAKMPLSEIIRYFKRNPYYKVQIHPVHLKVREFYTNVIKLRILSIVEESFLEIRKSILKKKTQTLFDKRPMRELRFYRIFDSFDPKSQGAAYFYHTGSLAVLLNYITQFYKQEIQLLIQVLARGVLMQNRITQNRMLLAASAIEDIGDKIVALDMSLSPDGENGKILHKFRFQKQADAMTHKLYQAMVLQVNKEVRGLLDRAQESFYSLKSMFEEVYKSPQDAVKIQLKKNLKLEEDVRPLEEHLKNWANNIGLLTSVLESLIGLERS